MATNTTTTSAKAWAPDVQGFAPEDAVPDALILATSVYCGTVEGDSPSVRVPYVSEDGAANIITEGSLITDTVGEFDEVVINTHKVSALGKFSRESVLQDRASEMILNSMQRSVVSKANAIYMANVSAPVGLLNNTELPDAVELGTNLDSLVDAQAAIEADGGTATHIVASPTFWAAAQKLKTGTAMQTPILGAGTEATQRHLLSIPVLVSPAVTAGSALMLDRNAIPSAYGSVNIARSDDAFFSYDVVAIRVTWRIGFNATRPNRLQPIVLDAG